MTEMLTITHDYGNTTTYDNMLKRARESVKRNGHKQTQHKTEFQINSAWNRCFTGREECEYAV